MCANAVGRVYKNCDRHNFSLVGCTRIAIDITFFLLAAQNWREIRVKRVFLGLKRQKLHFLVMYIVNLVQVSARKLCLSLILYR